MHTPHNPPATQLRRSASAILAVLAATALLLGALVWFHARTNVPYLQFTRDAAALRAAPWYTGILSQLGVMAWTAGAAAALTGACAVGKAPQAAAWRKYLLVGGVFSAWLALDDALMLHEVVIPHQLGIDERVVYALYIATALAFFALNWRKALAGEWPLLLTALVFLAVPVLADMLRLTADIEELLMAGSKLAGILAWAAYWGRCAVEAYAADKAEQPQITQINAH
ncbi:MAG: hypothetical protein LLG44_02590 [Chloroflexi bacterium]|nr:hypothetical protein [Chloroflexota bacterium]